MSPQPNDANPGFFDLSLIREHVQDDHDDDDEAAASSSRKLALSPTESYDSLPRLEDSLTAETTVADEDDSSVSTLGSSMSVSSRRSVFSKYWNATGQKPLSLAQQRSESCSSLPSLSNSQHSSSRRSIFVSPSSSSSSLSALQQQQQQQELGSFGSLSIGTTTTTVHERAAWNQSLQRKSSSMDDMASVLEVTNSSSIGSSSNNNNSHHRSRTPRASCLKRDRMYSGDRGRSHSSNNLILTLLHEEEHDDSVSLASCTSTVRFDLDATDVRLYETPMEVHANEGWSGFFH